MSQDIVKAFGIGACIVIALLTYLLHDALGLMPATAFKMAASMVGLAVATGGLWFFSAQSYDRALFGPGNLWPFLLALFVLCWFPALDEWSATWGTSIPSFLAYSDSGFAQEPSTGGAKFLWFLIPLAGGYGLKYWQATR